jgi:hypothetical protein
MTFKKFIAKLFKIKTTIEYKPETMGFPVPPKTKLQFGNLYVENNGKSTIYIGNYEH